MIIRNIQDLKDIGSYREKPGAWSSARYLLRDDSCGFTLTRTTIAAGSSLEMEYRNHLEANLVITGEGSVTDVASATVFQLSPGTMYTLDKHDRHVLTAQTDMDLVCVFTPALVGPETHDGDGSYPLL